MTMNRHGERSQDEVTKCLSDVYENLKKLISHDWLVNSRREKNVFFVFSSGFGWHRDLELSGTE